MYYYISDVHYAHKKIIEYDNRPFVSLDEMHDCILGNINKKVKKKDHVFYLGDWSLGRHRDKKEQLAIALEFRDRIKCDNVTLIYGNHDRWLRNQVAFTKRFVQTADLVQIHDPYLKSDVILCHYAFAVWNKSHYKSINLYGHSHSNAEEALDKIFPERRSMDVGVDNAYKLLGEYTPFSSLDILKLIGHRKGHTLDHHIGE